MGVSRSRRATKPPMQAYTSINAMPWMMASSLYPSTDAILS